jgi:hypothetical protein
MYPSSKWNQTGVACGVPSGKVVARIMINGRSSRSRCDSGIAAAYGD